MGDHQGHDCSGDLEKVRDFIHEKSLANRLYLKKKLYTFHMHPGMSQSEHIDEFHKLLEDVLTTLNSRELQKMTEVMGGGSEGLYVRMRYDQRDMRYGTSSAWSKSHGRSNRLRCNICQSEEHLKRDCPRYNYKKSHSFVRNEDQGMTCTGDEEGSSTNEEWVKFYVGQRQSGKIEVIRGSLLALSGTKRANCIYTLNGQEVTRKTLKGRKQLGEYQTGWKIRTGNVLVFIIKAGFWGQEHVGSVSEVRGRLCMVRHRGNGWDEGLIVFGG
nr:hypothetical protein [Tanacetum cinerariifolium]